jgi:hypothetical protein
MEKWMSKFGILKIIDASQDSEAVIAKAQEMLDETLKKVCNGSTYSVIVKG